MSRLPVTVVPTGAANLASVLAGLARAGAAPRLAGRTEDVAAAGVLVLPGVGAFGAAMEQLNDRGLVEAVQAHLQAGRPTLAICLGMQLLAEASEESPGVAGLGVLPMKVTRLDAGVRIPQLGWNRVQPADDCQLLQEGYAYFANSYRLTQSPPDCRAAYAEHGTRFVAALERGGLLACQFHPELSGAWGVALLQRWLARAAEGVPC